MFARLTMRWPRSGWLLGLAILSGVYGCAPSPHPIALTSDQDRTVALAQDYLNRLTVFEAHFAQAGWLGGGSGTLWVARPGRLRMMFSGRDAKEITVSGGLLTILDHANGAVTTTPLSRTPLGLLLDAPLRFSGAVAVTQFRENPSDVSVTLQDSTRPEQGTLTVRLHKAPLTLIGLVATDQRGRSFSLDLSALDTHPRLPPGVFAMTAPSGV